MLAMAYKLLETAQKKWKPLRGKHFAGVIVGVTFTNGIKEIIDQEQGVA